MAWFRETKPNGTLLSPPAHAHSGSRLSMYTSLNSDTASIVPMNRAAGMDFHNRILQSVI